MTQKSALIGHTGFVGSHLQEQYSFTHLYNSKNIHEIENQSFDLVVCAGIKAQKWYANHHPDEDLSDIKSLFNHLQSIKTRYFVLISTIDVYPQPLHVNEHSKIEHLNNHAYGKNRRIAELMTINLFKQFSIIRLPALFGKRLKKNFIFDLLNPIPQQLTLDLMKQIKSNLSARELDVINQSYGLENDVYSLKHTHNELMSILEKNSMTSLMFTDHRDHFQYYPLMQLWHDIELVMQNNLEVVNFATEPVAAQEVFREIFHKNFLNVLQRNPQNYDMQTIYGHLFGSNDTYILSKAKVVEYIKAFYREESK